MKVKGVPENLKRNLLEIIRVSRHPRLDVGSSSIIVIRVNGEVTNNYGAVNLIRVGIRYITLRRPAEKIQSIECLMKIF